MVPPGVPGPALPAGALPGVLPVVPPVPPPVLASSSSPHAEITAAMNGIDRPMTAPRRMKPRRLSLPWA